MSLASLSDAPGASPLVAAVAWLQGTVLGTIATTVAIIAVAWVGLLMLLGRFEVRRGMTVVAGCFILFGASAIVGGIRASVGGEDVASGYAPPEVAPPPYVPPPRRNPDPYAGASVPGR
jgi:type IV secretory pathway VirB2 component (pilin)